MIASAVDDHIARLVTYVKWPNAQSFDRRRDSTKANPAEPVAPTQPAKQLIAPYYEAWKHVEKFTLVEASYLWNDLEPKASGNYTPEVKVWIEAFRAAIRKGDLNFIPNRLENSLLNHEKTNPRPDTEVSRADLFNFALKYDYKPKFLSQHNHVG